MNKKIMILGLILIFAIGLGIFFYKSADPSVKKLDNSQVTTENQDSVVEANNKFAFSLYKKYQTKGDNIFFSPFSLSSALAITYEGARGQTAEEIRSVLYFPQDDLIRRSGYADLYNKINQENKKYELSTANALWAEQEFKFSDEYFDLINQYYGGKITNLNFKQDPEGSRTIINTWVEKATKDKIKDLIPSGFVTPLTRLILTNAVYFKGQWLEQFDKKETEEQNFNISLDKKVQVEMMKKAGEGAKFNYSENEQLQLLELPYDGEELSMLVLLPKENDLETLEKNLTPEKLLEWEKTLNKQQVDVFLPKFKFETKYFLTEDLKEMGMATAFSENADFSGMTGKKDLVISGVVHQAFVEVNEEGTEAAAATAVDMVTEALLEEPKIPVFLANHPFIFIIQQKDTGNILFMGRVNNPTK